MSNVGRKNAVITAAAQALSPLTPEEMYLSGFFDEAWYRSRYSDVGGQDALLHFVTEGDALARSPSSRFDPEWYLSQLPEGLGAATGPFAHYMKVGLAKGLLAIAPTDTDRPMGPEQDSECAGSTALAADDSFSVPLSAVEIYHSGLFDEAWYKAKHQELGSYIDGLNHFVLEGDALGWSPSMLFDADWYLEQIGGDLGGASGPLLHYLRRGRSLGIRPLPETPLTALLSGSALFHEAWYLSTYPQAALHRFSALAYFLTEGAAAGHDPCPWFDSIWYREEFAVYLAESQCALEHYILEGEARGYRPNPGFDPTDYDRRHPSSGTHGPLERFLEASEVSGDWSTSLFDQLFYVRDNPDVDFEEISPFVHFIRTGWREGRPGLSPTARASFLPPGKRVTFCVLVDGYQASAAALEETINSISDQKIGVCDLVVSSEEGTSIHFKNGRISRVATPANRAARLSLMLAEVRSEYFFVLDAGDILSPRAIEILSTDLRYDPTDILYTDEINPTPTPIRPAVSLKPGWSPELLTSYNYFGRLCVLRTDKVYEAGGFLLDANAAAEWDLALRLSETTSRIRRLPERLCSRAPDSDLDRPLVESRRSIDFRNVLATYWRRQGKDVSVFTREDGTLEATWPIIDEPLVSIIIPTRNKADLLRRAIDGILNYTIYQNKEIIIVDNLSSEIDAVEFLHHLQTNELAKVVSFSNTFNYSAACNIGATHSRGSLLLFLNNDIEVINPTWLCELVRFAQRPGVGVVGAMLLYPDRALQHAGVALGVDLAGLVFRGANANDWGVFGTPSSSRNWTAVMGACHMIKRDLFYKIGQYDDTYWIANSDVALCLKSSQAGYRSVLVPKAALLHHEGATRGRTNPPEDVLRLAIDIHAMGMVDDPYYHPDLDPTISNPTLKPRDHPGGREALTAAIARTRCATPRATRLDPTNVGDVATAVGLPIEAIRWKINAAAETPFWSTVRYAIDSFLQRPRGAKPFKKPFSSWGPGSFAASLKDATFVAHIHHHETSLIDTVFQSNIGARPQTIFQSDADARAASPLGLTPGGLDSYMTWLFSIGMERYNLRLEEIWWWALERAEHASTSLAQTWLVTPSWQQRFPDGLTPTGADGLHKWASLAFDIEADWVSTRSLCSHLNIVAQIRLMHLANQTAHSDNPRPFETVSTATQYLKQYTPAAILAALDRDDTNALDHLAKRLAARGVNLISDVKHSGEGKSIASTFATSLSLAGIEIARRDAPSVEMQFAPGTATPSLDPELYDISILIFDPTETVESFYARCRLAQRPAPAYRIAYWECEHDRVPPIWIQTARGIDEIWTSSATSAEKLREAIDRPVVTIHALQAEKQINTNIRSADSSLVPHGRRMSRRIAEIYKLIATNVE